MTGDETLPAILTPSDSEIRSPLDPPPGRSPPDLIPGRTPLEVIIKIMSWWDAHGDSLAARLNAMVVRVGDQAAFREAAAIARELIAARAKALEAASLAAPYFHGRVGAIPPALAPGKREAPRKDIPNDPIEACRVYLRLVRGTGGHNGP